MRRLLFHLAAALGAFAVLAPAAFSQEGNTLILEGAGEAGGYRLGEKIKAYPDVREVEEGVFEAPDGGLLLRLEGKEVVEIQIEAKRFATQKLIRPGQSTLAEVLEAYGRPERRCSVSGNFSARYGGLEFHTNYRLAGPLGNDDLAALLASRVESVVLRVESDHKRAFERGVESFEAREWEDAALGMERTLCDEPEGDPPRRVQTYGMKFLDYTPHYYLGAAWFELGRCPAALAEWDRSEEREDLERSRDKRATIESGRSSCAAASAATADDANDAPPAVGPSP